MHHECQYRLVKSMCMTVGVATLSGEVNKARRYSGSSPVRESLCQSKAKSR
jgi:hypothetical protein